ncbi:MAG: NADP-dependent oxidoreductase [Pseudomonadota bacterium]
MRNFQVCLKRHPSGTPVPDDFMLARAPMPEPGDGEVLIELLYLSVDPALRPRIEPLSAYGGAVPPGTLIPSSAIGVVRVSRSPLLSPGDHVFGFFGWQLYCAAPAHALRRIHPELAPLPKWMSVFGLSAFTAYIGMREFGRPQPGATVVVSAAAGATGAVAGQLARIAGARAVGIAGGAAKCRYVVETLGFDACIDHRATDFAHQLDAACPAGIDVDFENVGGDILAAILPRMNQGGRVVLCGLVAQYGRAGHGGPDLWPAVYNALTIHGLRGSHYFDRIPEFVAQALDWHAAGQLVHSEHIVEGIANAPAAFCTMLAGQHLGKAMVRVGPGTTLA